MNQEVTNLINLSVGFILTTVLGGVLVSYLQWLSWKNQNKARLKEEELKQGNEVCHSVSQLLDKRLYRMRLLSSACQGYAQRSLSKEVLEQRHQDHDEVLYEWNDKLNLNLALVGAYFGDSAREYLKSDIYKPFEKAGSELEQAYREVSQKSDAHYDFSELLKQLDQISEPVCKFDFFMMTQLRGGLVERNAPVRWQLPP